MASALAWMKLIKPTPDSMNDRPDPFWIGLFLCPLAPRLLEISDTLRLGSPWLI
jgi:hypothetical protein